MFNASDVTFSNTAAKASTKHGFKVSSHLTSREKYRSANPKFHAGPDPFEREMRETKIKPTDRQLLESMTAVLKKAAETSGDPAAKQAFALWSFQVQSGTALDQAKFQFLRRFYFWLLGKGDDKDHEKTLWGRGNAAYLNPEVAAYIDQFINKRTEYAQKLNLLSMRVPETLNGYYLYYKYIVNGHLRRVTEKDGTSFWDMSKDDYLEDFDIFQQVFDKKDPQKGEIVANPEAKTNSDMFGAGQGTNFAPGGHPRASAGKIAKINNDKVFDRAVTNVRESLTLGKPAGERREIDDDSEHFSGVAGEIPDTANTSDISLTSEGAGSGVIGGRVVRDDTSGTGATVEQGAVTSATEAAEGGYDAEYMSWEDAAVAQYGEAFRKIPAADRLAAYNDSKRPRENMEDRLRGLREEGPPETPIKKADSSAASLDTPGSREPDINELDKSLVEEKEHLDKTLAGKDLTDAERLEAHRLSLQNSLARVELLKIREERRRAIMEAGLASSSSESEIRVDSDLIGQSVESEASENIRLGGKTKTRTVVAPKRDDADMSSAKSDSQISGVNLNSTSGAEEEDEEGEVSIVVDGKKVPLINDEIEEVHNATSNASDLSDKSTTSASASMKDVSLSELDRSISRSESGDVGFTDTTMEEWKNAGYRLGKILKRERGEWKVTQAQHNGRDVVIIRENQKKFFERRKLFLEEESAVAPTLYYTDSKGLILVEEDFIKQGYNTLESGRTMFETNDERLKQLEDAARETFSKMQYTYADIVNLNNVMYRVNVTPNGEQFITLKILEGGKKDKGEMDVDYMWGRLAQQF